MMTLPIRQPIRVSEMKCAGCVEKDAREREEMIACGNGYVERRERRNTWEMLKEGLSPVASPR